MLISFFTGDSTTVFPKFKLEGSMYTQRITLVHIIYKHDTHNTLEDHISHTQCMLLGGAIIVAS